MSRLCRLRLLLGAATAMGCVYPSLNTSTGDTGGAAGGIPSVGGVVASGGAVSSGGIVTMGGTSRSGGISATGGDSGRAGGTVASGGAVVSGGIVGTGGVGTGGAGGATGGTGVCDITSCPTSCCNGNVCAATQTASMCGILGAPCGACGPTGTTVTFSQGKAAGAMTGYGWVALGSADTITDPTCGGQAITAAASYCLGGPNWNSPTALCMSGSIPALAATNPDYTNNWGVMLGVNATINQSGILGNFGQTLGQSFTSIAITVTGSPLSGLRVQVHRRGDPDTTNYCATLTSGTAIPFVAFNTKCYDFPADGVALTAADVPNIDQIDVQVPSGFTAITMTTLCITGITFSSGPLSACAPTPTGMGCKTAGYLNCGAACCASTLPYYCPATQGCFSTETQAVAACGSTACSDCVTATNI